MAAKRKGLVSPTAKSFSRFPPFKINSECSMQIHVLLTVINELVAKYPASLLDRKIRVEMNRKPI